MSKKENTPKQDSEGTKKQTPLNESNKIEQKYPERRPIRYFKLITGIILPFFALGLMFYEILLLLKNIFLKDNVLINFQFFKDFNFNQICFKELRAEHIFHALILSTTSVALVGMHRAVHKLVPTDSTHDKPFTKSDIAFFFTLMANALLLAGLILLYDKYYKKPEMSRHSNYDNAWNINNSDVFPR